MHVCQAGHQELPTPIDLQGLGRDTHRRGLANRGDSAVAHGDGLMFKHLGAVHRHKRNVHKRQRRLLCLHDCPCHEN